MEFVDICWVLRTMMRGSRVNKYEHVTEKQTHQTFQGWDMPLQYSRIYTAMDVVDGQKWETIPSLLEQVASFDNQKHLADMAQGTRSLVFSTKLSNRQPPPDSNSVRAYGVSGRNLNGQETKR